MRNKDIFYCKKVKLVKASERRAVEVMFERTGPRNMDTGIKDFRSKMRVERILCLIF